MYYQPDNVPHIPTTRLYRFKAPRNRHHKMTEAYTEGGSTIADASGGLAGFFWHAFIDGDDRVVLEREGDSTQHHTFTKSGITQLDVTFDQSMRPFFTYVASGKPYYYHFNADDSTYSEVALDVTIKYPRCELDLRDPYLITDSDIILGYTRAGNLCYRLQRERFLTEHVIATDPKKTMLWRIGLLIDDRFGYMWR